jgi:hypothetical protein
VRWIVWEIDDGFIGVLVVVFAVLNCLIVYLILQGMLSPVVGGDLSRAATGPFVAG